MSQHEPSEDDGSGYSDSGGDDPIFPDDPVVRQLRALYDAVASEPLPDHLVDLLQMLDEVERRR